MAYETGKRVKHLETGREGTILREMFTRACYLVHWDGDPELQYFEVSARKVEGIHE